MMTGGLVSTMANKVYSLPTMFAWTSDCIIHRYSNLSNATRGKFKFHWFTELDLTTYVSWILLEYKNTQFTTNFNWN